MTYDSTADTLTHSRRVGELLTDAITDLVQRSVRHDLSKTQPPELEVFNEFTPKLRSSTYGTDEYRAQLAAMGPALQHHYAANRHHPEHYGRGIRGMTLLDLLEMLADWRAAGERVKGGSMQGSLETNQARFNIPAVLVDILVETVDYLGWGDRPPTA